MKQFVRYLYEYVQGKRIRNVGFVKAEQGDRESILHIHGRGLRMEGKSILNLYLLYEKDGKCIGIPRGTMGNINPALNGQLAYKKDEAGLKDHYGDIIGIVLKAYSKRTFAAVWADRPIDVEGMIEADPKAGMITENEQPEAAAVVENEQPEAAAVVENEQPEAAAAVENKQPETDVMDDNRLPDKETKKITIRKIQRRELAQLPRNEWPIANNNFLLHGYQNYRHIAIIEDGNVTKLGVPGIYHEKEQIAARAFGFPEFWKGTDNEEDFGYWCRQIENNKETE